MLKRPNYIALGLVLFLVVVFLNLPRQTATDCKLAFGGLFLPLFGLAGTLNVGAERLGNSLTPRRVLITQLDQLRRENSQFRVHETQLANVWRENDELRKALHLERQLPWKVQFARIVLRDPANWWRTVQLDVGRQNGIAPGMPVVTLEGVLVGKILQVGNHTSRVALLGDPECGVSAVVQDGANRDFGVISSGTASVLDGSLVELTYVNRPSASKPGQKVTTSGLGGVFPPGILIGHIVETNTVGFGLYAEARVKLGANLDTIEQLWVVLP